MCPKVVLIKQSNQ